MLIVLIYTCIVILILVLNEICRVAIFEHIPAVTEASRDYYQQSVEEPSVKALGIEFEVCFVYQPDGKNVAKVFASLYRKTF